MNYPYQENINNKLLEYMCLLEKVYYLLLFADYYPYYHCSECNLSDLHDRANHTFIFTML